MNLATGIRKSCNIGTHNSMARDQNCSWKTVGQSQGSVERANKDIENMLGAWKKENHSTNWSEGLRYVQIIPLCDKTVTL